VNSGLARLSAMLKVKGYDKPYQNDDCASVLYFRGKIHTRHSGEVFILKTSRIPYGVRLFFVVRHTPNQERDYLKALSNTLILLVHRLYPRVALPTRPRAYEDTTELAPLGSEPEGLHHKAIAVQR
jgi:hypothetical protein